MRLDETYNPIELEERWYDFWMDSGFFAADEKSEKEPFTIVIPPPNVTGSLHMGHALFVTLQDILTRWKRMDGYEALWLPGTDHAGIATQLMVTKQIAEEGLTRHDMGREAFVERIWKWKEEKGGRIIEQMKRMGASCDWERERFTLDEGLNRAVREAFVRFYEDGLIYRAERMVNWDPDLQTVLSGLEVEQNPEQGNFWHLQYPLADGSGHIVVGTTRPETMLGDTAVAVHPDDERYTDLIGKMVKLPLVDREIPIIADTILPDPEKGTGAVKVTPAHDPNDFDCGNRHDLERIIVIGFDAKMTDVCPDEFVGLDRYAARKKVVKSFEELGRLEKIEQIEYAPGRGDRSGVIVEPLPMTQWFVNTEPLAKLAIDAVESGRTKIIPAVWKKTYDHFMYNIQPWCISRQLWWGHQIPAWYCDDCEHITVSRENPECCEGCGSTNFKQDEDVLDTWFSSGLWPFSTMGWPDQTPTLDKFYPTQVMETGFDILFFWVARMLMMGNYFMRDENDEPVTPFEDVFLHAMVRDQHGQKMSKTKGNVIDPLHLIYGAKPEDLDPKMHKQLLEQFENGVDSQGADALRFTLTVLAAQGRDVKLDISRATGYRAFLNKLWNASKFVLMNLEDWDGGLPTETNDLELSVADQWILHRLEEVTNEVHKSLADYRFNDYAQTIYHFVWGEFCDWYIEFIKPALYDETEEGKATRTAAQSVMLMTLERVLRLLHPITPFITEDIWKALPTGREDADSIMVSTWPQPTEFAEPQAVADIGTAIGLITTIRQIRGETGVKPKVEIPVLYLVAEDDARTAIARSKTYLQRLAKIGEVEFISASDADAMQHTATSTSDGVVIKIPLKGLIDVQEEVARLEKEIGRVEGDIQHVSRKLGNEKFVSKAPAELVQKERDKLSGFESEIDALKKSLVELQELG